MAINTNTSKSIQKVSEAPIMARRIEYTEKNMKRLMANAGCKTYETVSVRVPDIKGSKDDVLFCGLNGVHFYFQRGKTVDMPKPLMSLLTNCGEL